MQINKDPRPKVPAQHQSDRAGQNILDKACEHLSWINYPTPKNDYGFDGTIMVVQDAQATGLHFGYQLKTKKSVAVAKDGFIHISGIKGTTLNMWKASNLLPVIMVADRRTSRVYWDFIGVAIERVKSRANKTPTVTLLAQPNHFAKAGIAELVRLLNEQSVAMPRPIQDAVTSGYQLDRLIFEGNQTADIQDTVDFVNGGRYQRAADKAQNLLKTVTDNQDRVKLFRVLTKCMFELERFPQAIDFAMRGIALDKENLVLLNSLALGYLYNDQATLAIKTIRRARKLGPMEAGLANTEGVIWIRLGQYRRAKIAIDAALSLSPRNKEMRSNQAFLLRHFDKEQKALAAFRQLWEEDPTNHYAGMAVAIELFREHGRTGNPVLLKEAEEICDKVAAHFQKNPPKDLQERSGQFSLLTAQAAIVSTKGDAKRALKILGKVAPPKGALASTFYYNRGQMHLMLGDFVEARKDNVMAIREHAESAQLSTTPLERKLVSLGTAHLNLFGKSEGKPHRVKYINKAIRNFRAAMSLNSSDDNIADLENALILSGRADEAVRLAEKFVGSPSSHFTMAMYHKDRGEEPQWFAELTKSWDLEPNSFRANVHLGYYWYLKNEWEKAKGYLLKAYANPRPFMWAASPMMVCLLLECLHNTHDLAGEKDLIGKLPDFLVTEPHVVRVINAVSITPGRSALARLNTDFFNRLSRKL